MSNQNQIKLDWVCLSAKLSQNILESNIEFRNVSMRNFRKMLMS